MGHVFISYSRTDVEAIDKLAATLKEAAIEVWIDREGIDGGAKWRSRIVEAIKSAGAFVIALSPDSVKSENVRRELGVAEKAQKPIVPIVLRPTTVPTDLEYTLSSSDHAAGVSRLFKSLRELQFAGGSTPTNRNATSSASGNPRLREENIPRFPIAGLDLAAGLDVADIYNNPGRAYLPSSDFTPEKRRAILADPNLSPDERVKALSATFPASASREERNKAIADDAGLSVDQKIVGFVAITLAALESTGKGK